MDLKGKKIILGSGSPRRKELLAGMDIEFTVDTGNDFEESLEPWAEPYDVPLHMALGKSHGFHRPLFPDEILITADTVVIPDYGISVLGKPHSRAEAAAMLRQLSGRTHEVVTAVVIRDSAKEVSFRDSTEVTFGELGDDEIHYYIEKYRPFDKAGAYGVQEWIGYIGISRINGSFYNVVGFPVYEVWKRLKEFIG